MRRKTKEKNRERKAEKRCKVSLKLELQMRDFFIYNVKRVFYPIFISHVHDLKLFQLVNLDIFSFLVLSASGWVTIVSNDDIENIGSPNFLFSSQQ